MKKQIRCCRMFWLPVAALGTFLTTLPEKNVPKSNRKESEQKEPDLEEAK